MPPPLAAIVCVAGILGLFVLDRKRDTRASWVLWLPIIWLLICGSKHVSTWLGMSRVGSREQLYLDGSPLDAAFYELLIAAAVAVLIGRRRTVARVLRRNWPIVLFVLYCALSIVWSDFPGVALKRWIKSLGDYAMVLILLTEYDCEAAVKQVLATVAFVLLPLSILLIKYYPKWGVAYAAHWTGTRSLVGVADNKNMLGMVCMVFGFAAVCRVLHAWRGPRRDRTKTIIVHGAVSAMAIWLLILTDSKTSLSCFVLTSGLIAAHTFLKSARKPAVVHFMVATVILSCASVLFLGIGGGALAAMGRNPTLTGRTEIWHDLLQFPVNPVFGTGFESFWLGERLARIYSFPILAGLNEAHNGYLEMYLNLGWAGLACLAGLLWTGYRNILRLIGRDPEAGRLRLGFFLIAVVYNFTEVGIRSTDPVWIAFILAIAFFPERRLSRVPVARISPAMIALVDYEPVV